MANFGFNALRKTNSDSASFDSQDARMWFGRTLRAFVWHISAACVAWNFLEYGKLLCLTQLGKWNALPWKRSMVPAILFISARFTNVVVAGRQPDSRSSRCER